MPNHAAMQRPVASNHPDWEGYEWRQSIKNDGITEEEEASYQALQAFLQTYNVPKEFPIDIPTLQEISHFCVYLQLQDPLMNAPVVLEWTNKHLSAFLRRVFEDLRSPYNWWNTRSEGGIFLPRRYNRGAIQTCRSEEEFKAERNNATEHNINVLLQFARLVVCYRDSPSNFNGNYFSGEAEHVDNIPGLPKLRAALIEPYYHMVKIPSPIPVAEKLRSAAQICINSWNESSKTKRIKCATSLSILAGPEQKCFRVHQKVICADSKFFSTACSGTWKEGHDRLVKLPDIDPCILGRYIHWAYTGELTPSAVPDYVDCEDIVLHWELLELYLVAQFLLNDKLRDEVVDFLWCILLQSTASPFQPDFIDAAFKKSEAGCGLQRLILETYRIEYWGQSGFAACGSEFSYHFSLQGERSRVAILNLITRNRGRHNHFDLDYELEKMREKLDPLRPPRDDLDQCRYHDHESLDGRPCELPVLTAPDLYETSLGIDHWHLV